MEDIGRKSISTLCKHVANMWSHELTVSQRGVLATDIEQLIIAVLNKSTSNKEKQNAR